MEGAALVVASYLCYQTRSAMDAVNESQFIATAVLIIVFIASHQPIIIFLPVDPYIDEVIVSGYDLNPPSPSLPPSLPLPSPLPC